MGSGKSLSKINDSHKTIYSNSSATTKVQGSTKYDNSNKISNYIRNKISKKKLGQLAKFHLTEV